jgi:uroporphyrinogen decarboxylase
MAELTSHERIARAYDRKDIDRIPIFDVPWTTSITRWQNEGMPRDAVFHDFFGLDRICKIDVDNSPRFPVRVIEETDEYIIQTHPWGSTYRMWKDKMSLPEFLSFSITDEESWEQAKKRMFPSDDRVPWEFLKQNYSKWKAEGYWIRARLWFGFDVTHSYSVGTEAFLIDMMERPEWCVDQFNHELDVSIALLEKVWAAGYTFDEVSWDDDMGYKYSQFFSLQMYRDILKPVHKRAIDWIHSKGVKAHMHSCGDIRPFLPELTEIGLDAINPMEVKAGMDPVYVKENFGNDFLLRGGFDPQDWNNHEKTEAIIRKRLPVLMKGGGYLFASDHSIPDSVSLEDYRFVVKLAKEIGRY